MNSRQQIIVLTYLLHLVVGFNIPSSHPTRRTFRRQKKNNNSLTVSKSRGIHFQHLNLVRKIFELPQNEFSRPLHTRIILNSRRNQYNVDLSAEQEELDGLAKRFSLPKILKLTADLELRRDRHSSSSGFECIQVQGAVLSSFTQKCVRTNEEFEVDLDFQFVTTIRSSSNSSQSGGDNGLELGGMRLAQIEGSLGGGSGWSGKTKKGQKGKKGKKSGGGNRNNNGRTLSEMNMNGIEGLIQEIYHDEDVIEDQNIFGDDGFIDVGELVAQCFRTKLDPYPKKPGSKPVNFSITG